MTHAAQFALAHGAALLFTWILLQQAGVPIPSARGGEGSKDILPKKNATIAGNIVKGWGARNTVDHASMARKIACAELKLGNLVLSSALVNHTSLPEGAQLTSSMADCGEDRVRLRREESTITTLPALSPKVGCSANATLSQVAETRTLLA
jgi:hypothetical protein